jgi:hypothetical protein
MIKDILNTIKKEFGANIDPYMVDIKPTKKIYSVFEEFAGDLSDLETQLGYIVGCQNIYYDKDKRK